MRKAKQSRPTREETLGGIRYEPLTFPASLRVPEALRAEEDRALQDYIVAWTRVSGTSSMRAKAPRSIFCAAFWSNRAPQKAKSLKLFRVFYRQHFFNVECGFVVVDPQVPLPQRRPKLRFYDLPKIFTLQPVQVSQGAIKAFQSIFGTLHTSKLYE